MIRLRLQLDLDYTVGPPGSDFVFNIHAAHTARQVVCLLYTSPSPRD